MIAFFVTMPISIRKPITTGRLIAFCVMTSAEDGAADRERQRQKDGERLQEVREQQDQHAEHHHDARAHGLAEAGEDLRP